MHSAKNPRLPDPLKQPPVWAATCFTCTLLLMMGLSTASLKAQDKHPFSADPKAAKLGESQFRANCAFCDGLGARGGGRGPALTRARNRRGTSDAVGLRTINHGTP